MSLLDSSIRTFSRPVDRRLIVPLLAAIAVAGALVVGVAIGPVYIGPGQVWQALIGHADTTSSLIIREIRLPRVLVGAMVGANLAISGAILQGVTRNPLADPHVLGISAGAGVVAVAALVVFPGVPLGAVEPVAFVGGLVGGGLAYVMAWRGGVSPVRLALAGIAVTSMLTAITSSILVTSSFSVQVALSWLVGGLNGRSWQHFDLILPYFLAGSLIALAMSRQLTIISLGDEVATNLGQKVERTRLLLVALATLLASSAVSVAGLIGFVGLIVPHLARLTVGNDYRFQIPTAAFFGATLIILADTAARTVLDPRELPVGVLTAMIGGPVFIYLVRKKA